MSGEMQPGSSAAFTENHYGPDHPFAEYMDDLAGMDGVLVVTLDRFTDDPTSNAPDARNAFNETVGSPDLDGEFNMTLTIRYGDATWKRVNKYLIERGLVVAIFNLNGPHDADQHPEAILTVVER